MRHTQERTAVPGARAPVPEGAPRTGKGGSAPESGDRLGTLCLFGFEEKRGGGRQSHGRTANAETTALSILPGIPSPDQTCAFTCRARARGHGGVEQTCSVRPMGATTPSPAYPREVLTRVTDAPKHLQPPSDAVDHPQITLAGCQSPSDGRLRHSLTVNSCTCNHATRGLCTCVASVPTKSSNATDKCRLSVVNGLSNSVACSTCDIRTLSRWLHLRLWNTPDPVTPLNRRGVGVQGIQGVR